MLVILMAFLLAGFLFSDPAGALELSRNADALPAPPSAQVQLAVTNEQEAAELLPGAGWDAVALSEAASRIASLPDQAAGELLWRLASASPEVDALPVFTNALSAGSPRVRMVAAAILIGRDGAAAAFLHKALVRERDADVVKTVVDGLAGIPGDLAVSRLIDAVTYPEVGQVFLVEACARLRSLTGAQISDNPDTWKEWRRTTGK